MNERDELAGDSARPRVAIPTRAAPPRPRRLSRRALATLVGVSALGVAAALGYSLTASRHAQAPQQAVSVDHPQTSDVLTDAPKDYGDLARTASAGIGAPAGALEPATTPLLSGAGSASPSPVDDHAAAERERRRQQRDSARASKLFAGTSEGAQAVTASAELSPSPPGQPIVSAPGTTGNSDAQDRKAAFVTGIARVPTVNSGRLTASAARYVLTAGSTIAAALITGLSSDLPGQVVAQVTENVFDSITGRTLLIPQGSRLIGSYDAHVTYGQSRALVVWTRLILPDGRSLTLDRMIGTDAAGRSGFADRVDHHTGRLLGAVLLSTLFGLGSNLATSGGAHDGIAFAIRDSAGQSVERAGDRLVEHDLDIQPTITVRPGARVRVLVSRDLVLWAWKE